MVDIRILVNEDYLMKKTMIKRYSEAFKRQVVQEYEDGATLASLRQKYGIKGGVTITNWIRKYAHAGLRTEVVTIQRADERNRERDLQKRIAALETAVSQLTLDKIVLESSLAEAETLLGISIKKNDALPSSSAATDIP